MQRHCGCIALGVEIPTRRLTVGKKRIEVRLRAGLDVFDRNPRQ